MSTRQTTDWAKQRAMEDALRLQNQRFAVLEDLVRDQHYRILALESREARRPASPAAREQKGAPWLERQVTEPTNHHTQPLKHSNSEREQS